MAMESGDVLHMKTSSSFPHTPPTHAPAPAINCHCSVDPTTAEDALNNGPPHSRLMGATEQNWCRAVAGGTGVTVLGLLFSRLLQPSDVQHAIYTVQRLHPRLRSKLVWVNGTPGFLVSPHPFVKLEVIPDAVEPLTTIGSSEMKAESSLQSDNKEKSKDHKTQNQIYAVNSSETIVEFGLQSASKASSKPENNQRPTSATDSSEGIAESNLKDGKENLKDENYQKPSCANKSIEAMAESQIHVEGMVSPEEEKHHSDWLLHVENELNINIWPEEHNSVEPVQMFVARLYHLPRRRSALILRLHTAACDRVSAATLIPDILHALSQTMTPSLKQNVSNPNMANGEYVGEDGQLLDVHAKISSLRGSEEQLSAIEDLIPRGQSNKPFWAHGVDLLGYSLGSMRHASLPFQQPDLPRRSEIIRSALSVEHTQALLQVLPPSPYHPVYSNFEALFGDTDCANQHLTQNRFIP
ncbi:hypothetical protein O6H91_Y139700 [Diphasiastrum complanatum]|nr:hypothetical protein O6H91_Y139700 [Diphasiastrum complanatum]KAJ7299842.1 hypothetical protein O6H91_Y139700 [Diphasiastrum complanatum]